MFVIKLYFEQFYVLNIDTIKAFLLINNYSEKVDILLQICARNNIIYMYVYVCMYVEIHC